jgi:hypothetical protein
MLLHLVCVVLPAGQSPKVYTGYLKLSPQVHHICGTLVPHCDGEYVLFLRLLTEPHRSYFHPYWSWSRCCLKCKRGLNISSSLVIVGMASFPQPDLLLTVVHRAIQIHLLQYTSLLLWVIPDVMILKSSFVPPIVVLILETYLILIIKVFAYLVVTLSIVIQSKWWQEPLECHTRVAGWCERGC